MRASYLEIVVDFGISVFFGIALLVFSLFDGCFCLECGVLGWGLPFSFMVSPILRASLMSLLLLHWVV